MDKFDFSKNISEFKFDDIIELYNIKKYFDCRLFLETWTPEDIKRFKITVNRFLEVIARFINFIPEDIIYDKYATIDIHYRDDFWELIEKYKIFKKMTTETFSKFLEDHNVSMIQILACKDIVAFFGQIIRESLISNAEYAKILLMKYEMPEHGNRSEIYLPVELTLNDKENIISDYIEHESANLNYLRIIENIQSTKDLSISDRVRLKAKKRIKCIEKALISKDSGIKSEFSVSVAHDIKEEYIYTYEGTNINLTYSYKWISENQDYNTLLNNFIYLFNYVDLQMRITLISKMSELGVFERVLTTRSRKSYIFGYAFNYKDNLSKLQMLSYYNTLQSMDIRLEDVIEWFFKEYVNDEFHVQGFRLKLPSQQSLFFEKCRVILPEMESVLKQYELYIQDRAIDHDLLQISSNYLLYKEVKSMLKSKYVYGTGNEYYQMTFYLFSDQCMLSHIERISKEYRSFYELLLSEDIYYDDYVRGDREGIDWLQKHALISILEDGHIIPTNVDMLSIFKDLYHNEFLSYWHYPSRYRAIIDAMVIQRVLEFEDTLLARHEQEYFNYYLNKSTFNNALDLRNKYSHGTQPSGDDNEKAHEENYMIFLRLFVLVVIKINDELCIADSSEYKEDIDYVCRVL